MSDINNVKCKCNAIFNEEEFSRHFQKCDDFRKNFKDFDAKFGELLKQFSHPTENLLIIRVLLKQYIGVLEKKIRARYNFLKFLVI